MRKFFNLFLIFISLFVSLGANVSCGADLNLSANTCESICNRAFPSGAQVFINIDNNEGSIVASNYYLENVWNALKNDGIIINPSFYSPFINSYFSLERVGFRSTNQYINNNNFKYLENEIVIRAS